MREQRYTWRADLARPSIDRMLHCFHESGTVRCGIRSVVTLFLRGWLHVFHEMLVTGRENFPPDRSFVMIANHASHLDTLCLLSALPRHRLDRAYPVAAEDYFCRSAWRAVSARVIANALPIDRCVAPWASLRICASLLDKPGTVLILFPEGTRGGGSEPGEFKPGVGLLTAGRDLPVVPCHLAGTHAALPKGAWLPRPRPLRLTVGTPRFYAHLPPTKESAKRICRDLRDAVIALGRGVVGKEFSRPIGVIPPRRDYADSILRCQ